VKNIDLLISQSDNQDTRSSLNPASNMNVGVDDDYINRTVLISQVQELFPDLGDGFIDQCLNEFNNNPETVIAKLLDNDLPANLKNLSRTMKRKKVNISVPSEFSKPLPSQFEMMEDEINENPTIDEILKDRRNVFDNDEFDILRNGNVDMNKVILGKKNRGTFEKVFDDKSKVDKEQIKSIVHHYDMYDDEYDDTWDGINEFNVNIDNNDDDKDGNAEGDEAEKPKKQERNDAGGSSDPGIIYKATLMKWLESHPDVFLRNNRKSKHRKQLIDETGMSNEQIEGWYTMYQRNKKKRDEANNKSKGNNTNNSKTPPPSESSSENTKVKVENDKGSSSNNNNNNNHNRNYSNNNKNRSNKNNGGNNNNNNGKNQNNKNNKNSNSGGNNNNSNKNKDDDKSRNDKKDNTNNEKEGKGNNNRRNNNNRGNKPKGKDGEKNDSSEKSNKPQYAKKRSDADNHYRKAGRQRKLNFMMGGFE
jgi:hypothetical protein